MASGIQSLNEVYSRASPVDDSEAVHTSGQRQGLDRTRAAYPAVRPPDCKSAAEAFNVICGSSPGYEATAPSGAARLRRDSKVPLPPKGFTFARAEELLEGTSLAAWTSWRKELLRSPAEYRAALDDAGPVKPHVDQPRVYADLFCTSLRNAT